MSRPFFASRSTARFFNTNAADERRRGRVVRQLTEELATDPHGSLQLLVHSLPFGSLRPCIVEEPGDETTKAQLEMTFRVMAHSLVYWTQDLVRAERLQRGGRIYTLTSAGSGRVSSYGAASRRKLRWRAMPGSWRWSWPHEVSRSTVCCRASPTPQHCAPYRNTSRSRPRYTFDSLPNG